MQRAFIAAQTRTLDTALVAGPSQVISEKTVVTCPRLATARFKMRCCTLLLYLTNKLEHEAPLHYFETWSKYSFPLNLQTRPSKLLRFPKPNRIAKDLDELCPHDRYTKIWPTLIHNTYLMVSAIAVSCLLCRFKKHKSVS